MKKVLKNPVVYFFVLGFIVFGLHSFLNKDIENSSNDPFIVEMTSADIEWLRSTWVSRMKRQPTNDELQNLIDSYIREEILSREAVAMDLDERDTVIKRRLVQKLKFVFEDLAETFDPKDDELTNYMQENQGKYQIPEMISFTHVYFNPDKREDVIKEAKAVLSRLQAGGINAKEAISLADTIMMDASYSQKTPNEVARIFGREFSKELFSLQDKKWHGPIKSPFGVHLVYINNRVASRMPKFDRIRENVKYDYMYDYKKEVIEKAYNTVKSRYTILVEGLPYE